MPTATFRIWRGDAQGGRFQDYPAEVSEGMVVLDAIHQIQAGQANDLAVRWTAVQRGLTLRQLDDLAWVRAEAAEVLGIKPKID